MVDVALFCEDLGHDLFTRALVTRIASELGVEALVRPVSAKGGKGKALTNLRAWQRSFESGLLTGKPDLLVVVIDGNGATAPVKRQAVAEIISTSVFPRSAIGCPDPHIERWCFADAAAFRRVVGADPPSLPEKRDRDTFKTLLKNTLVSAGQIILMDPMVIAPDIVREIDLYVAGREQSLGLFIDDLRTALKTAK